MDSPVMPGSARTPRARLFQWLGRHGPSCAEVPRHARTRLGRHGARHISQSGVAAVRACRAGDAHGRVAVSEDGRVGTARALGGQDGAGQEGAVTPRQAQYGVDGGRRGTVKT